MQEIEEPQGTDTGADRACESLAQAESTASKGMEAQEELPRSLGWLSELYRRCCKEIDAKSHEALPSILALLMTPQRTFLPPSVVGPPADREGAVIYHDAHLFCGCICELYVKIGVILRLAGYEPDGRRYGSLMEALTAGKALMANWDCQGPSARSMMAAEYTTLVAGYRDFLLMLSAPDVIPVSLEPFRSIPQALHYTLTMSDVLFHLVESGSARAYLTSGYADPKLARSRDIEYTLTRVLEVYKEAVAACMHC